MVTAAEHGAAMANGHPDLKEAADFVCGHNHSDGIVDVVEYIRKHNEQQPRLISRVGSLAMDQLSGRRGLTMTSHAWSSLKIEADAFGRAQLIIEAPLKRRGASQP